MINNSLKSWEAIKNFSETNHRSWRNGSDVKNIYYFWKEQSGSQHPLMQLIENANNWEPRELINSLSWPLCTLAQLVCRHKHENKSTINLILIIYCQCSRVFATEWELLSQERLQLWYVYQQIIEYSQKSNLVVCSNVLENQEDKLKIITGNK